MIWHFESSLYDGTWKDVIEVNSFVNWIMAHDILGSSDGGGTNMFILKEDSSTKIEMPCLWDFGAAMNMRNQWSETHGSKVFAFGPLFDDVDFCEIYKQKWNNSHQNIIGSIIDDMLNYKTTDEIKALDISIMLNNTRWNTKNRTATERINGYVEWFESRERWITENIDNL